MLRRHAPSSDAYGRAEREDHDVPFSLWSYSQAAPSDEIVGKVKKKMAIDEQLTVTVKGLVEMSDILRNEHFKTSPRSSSFYQELPVDVLRLL